MKIAGNLRLLAGLTSLLAGCAAPQPTGRTATPGPGVTLTPYVSPAPSETRTPTPGRFVSPTPPPTPTATPYRYTIVAGDTLIGIAFRFGLTLADILAANPGIDPRFLTIGDDLIIPVLENPAAAAAIPTPVGFVVPVGDLDCFPSADGGLWCFQLFENRGDRAVEGLSAQITVFDAGGDALDVRTGLLPVNLLPPGTILPAAAWFPDAGSGFATAGLSVLSAIPVQPGDARYVDVTVDYDVELDGASASVAGTVAAVPGQPVSRFRIGLVALDAAGRVVGVRVLELEGSGLGDFEAVVYSLAGEIDRVVVAAEGYP